MSNSLMHKFRNRDLRENRTRAKIFGTASRPRLSVHISNRHILAQLIDDSAGRTMAYATTDSSKAVDGTMTERAVWVGKEIAKKAKSAKIKQVIFDRGGKIYHGRIKALADAVRQEGLEF